ncbi:alpha-xylosidase [Domibacillus enclensis]|uniref:alpha-D-xyloside xylohydrolase n=1 Tax=Domibacillus enclensis TaxID=1017273 RepID=A0A1N7AGA8_9BACI|nr:alpha-xylosidase [Domibacillus enclensis]OXS75812.1 alpha-xylosidase [Domibacillus enclensis]SIR38125.1 alpha-D-xyloside xylohydrolase [Domibacillus enclensis]
MKFSNGNWMDREGFTMHYPAQLHEADVQRDRATLYAPFVPIVHRGNTLDGGMMTIELTAPAADVVGVKMIHHKGRVKEYPTFAVQAEGTPFQTTETDEAFTFQSGRLQTVVNKSGWSVQFKSGDELLVETGSRNMSYIVSDNKKTYMREQLSLDVGELIYGLGERFAPFVKNGQTIDIWNEDGGTGSEQAYKSIPFYMSNKGYGVFVNQPENVSFEVGSEKVSNVQFSVEGESLEYYVIYGPTMKEVLTKYTALTGKPALPPAWSFGLWLSTSFTTEYDEDTVNEFVDGMIERDIPLDVFHFDCFWMKEFEWCNFEWDDRVFPEPESMLKRLKDKGLKICVWINPYIGQKSPLFEEGMKAGYFLKRGDGSVWQWDKWQAGQAIVDFTNPDACRWFEEKLSVLMDMGVDSFKTDFGERIPTDVVYHNGADPDKMHNYYTYLYNETVFNLLERKKGKGEAALFARSATVGSQKFPVHWGGDCWSNYRSMAETLRGGLSFSLSGFSFWSHDISGFEHGATPDLFKRWTQFGLLSSHSRYHGSTEYKVPWKYGEEAVDVARRFTKLKNSLMPYLFAHACEATKTGVAMMRPMVLEFPEDETCYYLDRQYMLGEALLVAPIFNDKGTARYYVPEGSWTNYLTGDKVAGGRWYKETHGYMTLPLLVKGSSLLITGAEEQTAEYDFTKNVTLHVFDLQDGETAQADVWTKDGVKAGGASVSRTGRSLVVKTKGLSGCTVQLHHESAVESVEGGKPEGGGGMFVVLTAEQATITLNESGEAEA